MMDYAATEMSRLRVGATVPRRAPPKSHESSPKSTPQPSQFSPKVKAKQREEKATSNAGAMASLLHIQLAQINRMTEAVKIEVGGT